MPYLGPGVNVTPTPPAPSSPSLPVHSLGRPGHRRSISYTPAAGESTTGAFTPLASLPRRKPASFHLAEDDDDSSPEDNSPPKDPAPIASLPTQQQQHAPSSSQQGHGHGGRHSRSSSLSSLHAPPTAARFAGASGLKPTPAGKPTNLNTDDEDDGRGLPPLKLRIPGLGGFGQAGSGASSPRSVSSPRGSSSNLAGGFSVGSPVPFPKSVSPPRSRTSSNPVDVKVTAATPATATAAETPSGGDASGTASPRPSFSRTSSSPMILANGKPLKSSLKSSSSSPNIPFPSQSILPSRLYAEIANAQRQREQEQRSKEEPAGGLMPNQRHTRAASAPNLPNFDVSSVRPGKIHRHGAATPTQDSPPSYLDEDEEDEADTPGYEYGHSGSQTAPSTPSAPKAVHFPSSEEGGLTTVRVFKRTAKPVNLLLPGASGGEETETETDGEGYNSSGPGGSGAGAGYHYGIHNTWGFSASANAGAGAGGGYQNPWDRYTRQNTHVNRGAAAAAAAAGQGAGGGYPFPRVQIGGSGRMVVPTRQSSYQGPHGLPPYRQPSQPQHSGLANVVTLPNGQAAPTSSSSSSSSLSTAAAAAASSGQASQTPAVKEKKRILYDLDSTSTSTVPKRDLAMFDNVFLESIDLQCTKTPPTSSGGGDTNEGAVAEDSSEDDEETQQSRVSPALVCMLEGTLLVRNVAYEKHVSVRFTLDDWHTTSEVKASYRESLGSLPDKWRSWVLGDRSSSTPSSPSSPTESKLPSAPPAGSNPQWDRFSFSINLSDYARGRSLSSRTLWLVARYAVPGDVRVPVPKLLPGFHFASPSNSLNPPLAGGGDDPRWESELLRRCERDMVEMLVSGLGSSIASSTGSQGMGMVTPVRQMVDGELRKRQIGVGAGMGCEWWDNNASGNYRIGFREREVVTKRIVAVEPVPVKEEEQAKQEQGEPSELGLPALAQRRKNVSSCPPAFANAPPIYGYSALSLPQITPSTSTDCSSGDPANRQRSASSGSLPSPAPKWTTLPTSHSTGDLGSLATGALPNTSARRAETNKAMAETTLERLKRLNLRNYAAPGMGNHARAASASASVGSVNSNVSPPSTMSSTPTSPPAAPPAAANAPPTNGLGLGSIPLGSTLGVAMGRTSSNPLPLGTPPALLPEDRRNPQPSPLAVAHLATPSAQEPPAAIQTSHSQESTSSTQSQDRSSSEAGTNDSTPLTSPLHTPTLGAVDIPPAVRVRVGNGSEEASPNSEGVAAVGNWRAEDRASAAAAASAAKVVKESITTTPTTQGEQVKTSTPEDGILRPLLSRNSTVVHTPTTIQTPGEHEEHPGSMTPTVSSHGLSIPIPGRVPSFEPRNNDLLSPLLEPMMSGGPTSFGALGMELGTSPPFSSLGEGSFGGRTLSSTSLDLNLLPDFGATSMGSGIAETKQPTTRGPIPMPLNLSGLNLKPKQIGILEGIREKSTSSPPRSPSGGGSGRSSPAPLLLPRSFSNSSIPEAQNGVVVDRVDGITGTVKPPLATLTPLSSLRDSTTASSLLDTPKPSGPASTATLAPANGRRVVSDQGARRRDAASPANSGGSGSESNGSSSKSGSGGSSSGRKSATSTHRKGGARSPPPRTGLGLVFAQQQGALGGTKSPGSPLVPPPMSPSSLSPGADDIRDPDSIYQAFVKQWCFASAPSPAQAGGFGRKGA